LPSDSKIAETLIGGTSAVTAAPGKWLSLLASVADKLPNTDPMKQTIGQAITILGQQITQKNWKDKNDLEHLQAITLVALNLITSDVKVSFNLSDFRDSVNNLTEPKKETLNSIIQALTAGSMNLNSLVVVMNNYEEVNKISPELAVNTKLNTMQMILENRAGLNISQYIQQNNKLSPIRWMRLGLNVISQKSKMNSERMQDVGLLHETGFKADTKEYKKLFAKGKLETLSDLKAKADKAGISLFQAASIFIPNIVMSSDFAAISTVYEALSTKHPELQKISLTISQDKEQRKKDIASNRSILNALLKFDNETQDLTTKLNNNDEGVTYKEVALAVEKFS
ncbi:MAG: hypothetical protein CO035_03905, partial [Candidatus Omnitrophica bacterium CG_4_9_14_0_2_um_filter_42_8]